MILKYVLQNWAVQLYLHKLLNLFPIRLLLHQLLNPNLSLWQQLLKLGHLMGIDVKREAL
jgi:hypothetical protein